MRDPRESGGQPPGPELAAVGEAAAVRLRAEAAEDDAAAREAGQALMSAATAAMGAGYSLGEIARAEAYGHESVRRALHDDLLKRVNRTARQVHDAEAEHHRAIVRAVRLGLSTREIAQSAGVTHGTVRAIVKRLTGPEPDSDSTATEPFDAGTL